MSSLAAEIKKRRTFAIISHPDAGKTTITEKVLLHGGVIQEAGEVKGKAGTKAATSDWMKLEQQRGVSITSSVMQFDYEGLRLNLIDTPGHKDFGEDTYRVLHAADSAAMLLDAGRGVELQTKKLYEVCRLRKMPIFTFANKMDREGKSPLDLIDDVESTLHMHCYPVTWPMGMGADFRGLYHRFENNLYLYKKDVLEPTVVKVESAADPLIAKHIGEELFATLQEELELLQGVLSPFDPEAFLRGEISPMTFGSAKYNWGVDLFLRLFAQYAPPPQPRVIEGGDLSPVENFFSGFVFKIQANMDKRHRDRVAFIRICSGKFERGMKVHHTRLNREIRLAYANQFMARDRETVEVAYSGDIVGINDTGNFQIGDSVSDGRPVNFAGIPRFSPEHFGKLVVSDALKRKQLEKGVRQLVDEGSIQLFYDPRVGWQDPILGVVGILQFDVLLFRLQDEYGVDSKLDSLPYTLARWPVDAEGKPTRAVKGTPHLFQDVNDLPVVLFQGEWDYQRVVRENADITFKITSA